MRSKNYYDRNENLETKGCRAFSLREIVTCCTGSAVDFLIVQPSTRRMPERFPKAGPISAGRLTALRSA